MDDDNNLMNGGLHHLYFDEWELFNNEKEK